MHLMLAMECLSEVADTPKVQTGSTINDQHIDQQYAALSYSLTLTYHRHQGDHQNFQRTTSMMSTNPFFLELLVALFRVHDVVVDTK
jgi:hypothetical protein